MKMFNKDVNCSGALTLSALVLLTGCYGSSNKSIPEIKGEPLEVYFKEWMTSHYYFNDGTVCGAPCDSEAIEPEANDALSDSDSSYSETNVQELGVDEADLVKQNGDYLYAVQQPEYYSDRPGADVLRLNSYVTSASPVESSLLSSIEIPFSNYAEGLYLTDERVVTLSEGYLNPATASGEETYRQTTSLSFYDLTDGEPTLGETRSFDGYLLQSRVVNSQLYLALRFSPRHNWIDDVRAASSEYQGLRAIVNSPLSEFLPNAYVDGEVSEKLFQDGLCHLPDASQGGYSTIVSVIRISLDNPDDWEAKCNSGRLHGVYASANAFILTGYNNSDWDSTRLDWYELDDFRLIATGSVPGVLSGSLPSFRMSERDGLLRIVTSSSWFGFWEAIDFSDVDSQANESSLSLETDVAWEHRLFTIAPTEDNAYRLVSQLPNEERRSAIGKPGEDVRSVRFRGDRAYVVTFRQTDPLYVINLEDEADPYIEGELEITGFSSYLHPLNDNLLLGLGYAATDTGFIEGLKLSLFDVSTPADPTEVSTMRLGGPGSSAEAMSDNRASSYLRVDDHTTRLAFAWVDVNDDYEWVGDRIFVADIDESNKTFTEKLNLIYEGPGNDSDYYRYWNEYTRVLLHDDGLHFVRNGEVESGSLNDISFE